MINKTSFRERGGARIATALIIAVAMIAGVAYFVSPSTHGLLAFDLEIDPLPGGCTDPAASNWNPIALEDDGSCVYAGCTDPAANNYEPLADPDDGSCTFDEPAEVEQTPPVLTIIKELILDSQGALPDGGFTFRVTTPTGDQVFRNVDGDFQQDMFFFDSGDYSVAEDAVGGFETSYSDGCSGNLDFDERATCIVTNNDIGYDFGDAPGRTLGFGQRFPTTLAYDGARHLIDGSIYLGEPADAETDGQPEIGAKGDDISTTDDEGGVSFPSKLKAGTLATVNVSASQDSKLDAWVDFNADGDWGDAGENVFSNYSLVSGTNVLQFSVPITAFGDNKNPRTYTRWRVSSDGGHSYTGLALDGEVEDHTVNTLGPSLHECVVEGYKYDHNNQPIEGWEISLRGILKIVLDPPLDDDDGPIQLAIDDVADSAPGGIILASDFTDEEGYYCILREDQPATGEGYQVGESLPVGWNYVNTEGDFLGSPGQWVDVDLPEIDEPSLNINFYNEEQCIIEGHKYDDQGLPLSGWTIGVAEMERAMAKIVPDAIEEVVLNPWETLSEEETDQEGYYCFTADDIGLESEEETGRFRVFENLQEYWTPMSVEIGESPSEYGSDSFFDVFVDLNVWEAEWPVRLDFFNLYDPPYECSDGQDNDGDGLADERDDGCHSDGDSSNPDSYEPEDNDETDERIFLGGGGYPSSSGGGSGGEVLGATFSQCGVYLNDYLSQGTLNDSFEVGKLQLFLVMNGYDLEVTGIFDIATYNAVTAYQVANQAEVLDPWASYPGFDNSPTGRVFKLTRWKINDSMCEGSESYPSLP